MKKNFFIIIILLLSGLSGGTLSLYLHRTHLETSQQSELPVIQTFHYPTSFVKQITGDPDAGRKIFKEFCSACHNDPPYIDIPAPRIGDKKAWAVLRRAGMSTLLNITIKGAGAMPARGGCFECSDEQLREAIQYILHQS